MFLFAGSLSTRDFISIFKILSFVCYRGYTSLIYYTFSHTIPTIGLVFPFENLLSCFSSPGFFILTSEVELRCSYSSRTNSKS